MDNQLFFLCYILFLQDRDKDSRYHFETEDAVVAAPAIVGDVNYPNENTHVGSSSKKVFMSVRYATIRLSLFIFPKHTSVFVD